ncbi:hypothetical protein [Hydrogenophaga sp. 5NK40-0174]|uniref:hypothetical protein n=1 Tax=Hydrogenophaga sp. 5NK40-0174 TaxID=3127649 RepID=UPI0033412DB5
MLTPAQSGVRARVVVVDSITAVTTEDAGSVVVSGSHGGVSSAHFALRYPMRLVVFNDAGGGKDGAGMAALNLLQDAGVAAATVSHTSARIGDGMDAWEHGAVSHGNVLAAALGLVQGRRLREHLQLIDFAQLPLPE